MPNKRIAYRVKSYFDSRRTLSISGMAELSPQAVAVIDNWDEMDVYFDVASYRVVHERIWRDGEGKNSLVPRALERTGLGVLPGKARVPEIKSYADALEFTKRHLEPLTPDAIYYTEPVELINNFRTA